MARHHRVLTVLLLTLLQVGLLPVRAVMGGVERGLGEPGCGCCTAELLEACCCCGGEAPPQQGGCPCVEEHPGPALPALPPRPDSGRPELPAAAVGLAAPRLDLVALDGRGERAPALARRPVARAGPPLYRLHCVDRR